MFTIDEELSGNPFVTLVSRDDENGLYTILIGELSTEVTIELNRSPTHERTRFALSHAIKAPTQADAYRTSKAWDDTPGRALHKAIHCLTEHYKEAVNHGHAPDESWLIPYRR